LHQVHQDVHFRAPAGGTLACGMQSTGHEILIEAALCVSLAFKSFLSGVWGNRGILRTFGDSMHSGFSFRLPASEPVITQSDVEILVDEVEWADDELRRRDAAVQLLGEAWAQSTSLFFHTVKALRGYAADLEGLLSSLGQDIPEVSAGGGCSLQSGQQTGMVDR
jgi:hypothetical protein